MAQPRGRLKSHGNPRLEFSEVTEEMVSLVDEIFKARLEKNKAEVSKKNTTLEVVALVFNDSETLREFRDRCVYPRAVFLQPQIQGLLTQTRRSIPRDLSQPELAEVVFYFELFFGRKEDGRSCQSRDDCYWKEMCSLVMENPSHWKVSALKSLDLEEEAAANRVGGLVFPFNGRAHNIMTPKILQEVRKMDRRLREDAGEGSSGWWMPDLAYVSTALDKIMREAKDEWSAEYWTGVAYHARFAELLTNQTSDNEDEPVIELPDDMTPWQLSGLLYNLDLWRKLRENAAMYKIYTKSGEDIAVFAEAFGLAYKVSAPVKKEAKKPATPKQDTGNVADKPEGPPIPTGAKQKREEVTQSLMVMDKLYNDTKERLSNQGEIDPEMSELEVSAKVIWNLRHTISIDQETLAPEACEHPCFQKLLTQTPDRRSSSQAGGNHLEGAELARAVWYSSSHFYQQRGMSDIYGGPSTPGYWKKMCAAVLDEGGVFMKETLQRKDNSKESNDGAANKRQVSARSIGKEDQQKKGKDEEVIEEKGGKAGGAEEKKSSSASNDPSTSNRPSNGQSEGTTAGSKGARPKTKVTKTTRTVEGQNIKTTTTTTTTTSMTETVSFPADGRAPEVLQLLELFIKFTPEEISPKLEEIINAEPLQSILSRAYLIEQTGNLNRKEFAEAVLLLHHVIDKKGLLDTDEYSDLGPVGSEAYWVHLGRIVLDGTRLKQELAGFKSEIPYLERVARSVEEKLKARVPAHLGRIDILFCRIKKKVVPEKEVKHLTQTEITAKVLGHETLQKMMMKNDDGFLFDQICQYPPISHLLTWWSFKLDNDPALSGDVCHRIHTDLTQQLRAEIVAALHVFLHTQWTENSLESFSGLQERMAYPSYWGALQQILIVRRKVCTTIREGLARWLKEGPKSRQRADHEKLRLELVKDLRTQLQHMREAVENASGTVLEQGSGANSSMGAQTNITSRESSGKKDEMASLYDTLAKKFPGLGGEELDRKIFHQPDFQTKMRTSEDMFKSVIKFLKFKKFGVEMSSRMITSIHPIIKELMEFEKSKFKETGAKPASSKPKKGGGGKKGAKGAAKGVGNPIESKILIDTCQELLNVLEAFNTEERLGEPLCQVRIREKMVTIIRARLIGFGANIFDIAAYPAGHKVSPNIFESRMKQTWRTSGPLTKEEESQLLELRREREAKEEADRITPEPSPPPLISFEKDFVPRTIEKVKSANGKVKAAEIPLKVFFHKDFKTLLAYKSFRQYVFSLPQYKQAGQKFNEDVVKDLTLKLDSMLKNPSKGPKWTGPFFGRKKPRVKTKKNRKEKRRQPKQAKAFTGKKQDNFVKALTKTKVKLEGFVSKANIADPNFVPKMERAISLTKRVVKKKKGGKRSGKAKGEKKKEKKTNDAGSKKKKSKKDKKRKIKRKLVNVRLVPSVFTTSRASDKIWGRFDKDELVLKVVKEDRENIVEQENSEVKKIVASQPEEERREIVKATLKEQCVELLREEKRRLKKKAASVSPPPQSCGATLRNAAGQRIQIVPTGEEEDPVPPSQFKGPKDAPTREVD